jgi:Ni/Co efflux regulator RcnB
MKKLLVALIAAAFAATAFAQAPKSTEPAPATKTEKSDKKAKAKGEKKAKSTKAKSDKKSGAMDKKASTEKKDAKK